MNAVDATTIAKAEQSSPAQAEMQALMAAQLGHDRGECVHTTSTAEGFLLHFAVESGIGGPWGRSEKGSGV